MDPAGGKHILITGGTSGIGLAAAHQLARRGANVTIVGRSWDKGQGAVDRMQAEAGGHQRYLPADLSTLAGVRRLAGQLLEGHEPLDVLINNAGGMYFRRHRTADGYERTLALNHLAPFLLTHLLLPALRAAGSARIVTTSSAAHWSGQINLDDLHLSRGYSIMRAYSQTKLANILFSNELARRLAGSGVTANSFHPGLVATNLAKQNLLLRPFVSLFYSLFARSAEEGAETLDYLALDPEVEGQSGGYYVECKPARSSTSSQDAGLASALWARSERLVGLDENERLPSLASGQAQT